MKLKKLLIASAVVAAVAGAMSTAAFAEGDFVATYENGTVTLGAYTEIATDNTMVIVDTGADGEKLTEINEENIHQINQQAGAYTAIPVGELAPGKYEVRIGGDGNLYSAIFEVKGEVDPDNPYADSTRLVGDPSGDSKINNTDATYVINHVVSSSLLTGESLQAADINDDAKVNNTDATYVVNYVVGSDTATIDGVKVVGDKANYVEEN